MADFVNVGGGWTKASKKGNDFITVSLEINGEKIGLYLFPAQKKNERQPDYRVSMDQELADKLGVKYMPRNPGSQNQSSNRTYPDSQQRYSSQGSQENETKGSSSSDSSVGQPF